MPLSPRRHLLHDGLPKALVPLRRRHRHELQNVVVRVLQLERLEAELLLQREGALHGGHAPQERPHQQPAADLEGGFGRRYWRTVIHSPSTSYYSVWSARKQNSRPSARLGAPLLRPAHEPSGDRRVRPHGSRDGAAGAVNDQEAPPGVEKELGAAREEPGVEGGAGRLKRGAAGVITYLRNL